MTASKLLDRVVEGFRTKGVEPWWINYKHEPDTDIVPNKTIHVHETDRMNYRYDLENVTVTIEVTEWERENYGGASGKRLFKIKVPKNASDKVINNRIDKALEYYR